MGEINFKPKTLFTRDNLYILRGMNSECIDLIYLDPPFNSKKNYQAPLPIKDEEILASFKDVWKSTDIDDALHNEMRTSEPCLYEIIKGVEGAHSKGMFSYLVYMAIRLIEMRRVLKPTGSIYLHCDPTASHYLKIVMDCIFKNNKFKNEVIWSYDFGGRSKNMWPRKHDIILYYSKSNDWTFNFDTLDRIPYKGGMHLYRGDVESKKEGKTPTDVWDIPIINTMAKERTGYPTQKPLTLLERIIKASSNKGELVLDPFCGCTTALIAAEKLERKWVGIDVSPFAKYFVKHRFEKELGKQSRGLVTTMNSISGRTDITKEKLNDHEYKRKMYEEQQRRCAGCESFYHIKDMTIDHKIPTSKGGQDIPENKQLLCFHCNTTKGIGSMEMLKNKLRKAGILEEYE